MSDDPHEFEEMVRRVARLLWNEAALGGSQTIEGRERDGVFETRDAIHIVEATISRRKDKAENDAKKTATLVNKNKNRNFKGSHGWLITKEEPTDDQKRACEKYKQSLTILSFDQFRSRLFNGYMYLSGRVNYKFGSVKDIDNQTIFMPREHFIHIDLFDHEEDRSISFKDFSGMLEEKNSRLLLLGEYGSGKSACLREIFYRLKDRYDNNKSERVPVYINLRDHTGQAETTEALERHSRLIGYADSASDLVRAWRAGTADLILDGFDELATAGWGGSLNKVREHRQVAMSLVRNFVSETPKSSNIIISGRDNFFDSKEEMIKALGLGNSFKSYETTTFSDEQAEQFLELINSAGRIPDWLPSRPLLIAHLASIDMLQSAREIPVNGSAVSASRSRGWAALLDMISMREAEQDNRLDGQSVRTIIERLATRARSREDGLGQIDIGTIQDTFRSVTGFPPDDAGQQFLLRLPGLGPTSAEDSTRAFVDPLLADAARAGDTIRYAEDNYNDLLNEALQNIVAPLGEIAKEMVSDAISDNRVKSGQVKESINQSSRQRGMNQVSFDLLSCLTLSENPTIDSPTFVSEAMEEFFEIHSSCQGFNRITISDCLISHLSICEDVKISEIPNFSNCVIGELSTSFDIEPISSKFVGCDISQTNGALNTSNSILSSKLPNRVRVLVSILRKLYLQSGRGRQESAFYRGRMDQESRNLVPEVLRILQRHGIAEPVNAKGRKIWLPNRSEAPRVRKILSAPSSTNDPLIRDVNRI